MNFLAFLLLLMVLVVFWGAIILIVMRILGKISFSIFLILCFAAALMAVITLFLYLFVKATDNNDES